jgi:maleate isomerase
MPSPRMLDLSHRVELDQEDPEIGVGVVAPFDFVLDHEYWRWAPAGVSVYITRTPYREQQVGIEMARQLSQDAILAAATRELKVANPVVTAFACTSGSFVEGLAGEARCRCVMEKAGARRALTTSGALLDALRALGVARLAVATPYDAATSERLLDFLVEADVAVPSCAFGGLKGNIFRLAPTSVRQLVTAADDDHADAVFVSCTNVGTFDLLADLERELHKPVLSANQVTMWACLRTAGVRPSVPGQRLFACRG